MPKHVIDYSGPASRAAFIAGVECEVPSTRPPSTRTKVLDAWTMWDAFRRERFW